MLRSNYFRAAAAGLLLLHGAAVRAQWTDKKTLTLDGARRVSGGAVAEAHRILRPGGRVLVLDLRAHDQTWVMEKLGDRWLGFADDQLAALLKDAGFSNVTIRTGASRQGDPFTVLIATGTR